MLDRTRRLRLPVGRKLEDEREAVRCLRVAERTGLSAGEWARGHGIDGRSPHAWQVNIARRGTLGGPHKSRPQRGRAPHALVELVPEAAPAMQGVGCVFRKHLNSCSETT